MLNITKEQLQFINDEFGISERDIEKMDDAGWKGVLDRCLDIVVDEADTADVDSDAEIPERYLLAEDICEISFAALHLDSTSENKAAS